MTGQIDKMTVRGFKSIKELVDFEFHKLNVIVGANGAGKSNLVQVFSMIHAMSQKGFQNFVTQAGGADTFPFNGLKNTKQIDVEFSFGDNGYVCCLTPTADERLSISEGRRYGDHGWTSYGTGLLESRLAEEKDEKSSVSYGRNGIGYFVYRAVSQWTVYHFQDTSPLAPPRRSEIVEDCNRLRDDGANIAPFLLHLKTGNETERNSYRRIRDAIRLVMPFFDDFILDVVANGASTKVKLSWRQKGSDYPFQAYHLSDGSLRFICLATAFLQPAPPPTIIVDEPELGLHPAAIAILADLIKTAANNTQVIVATQSPQLIDAFGIDDLIVARRMGGGSVFERLAPADYKAWLDEYSLGELWMKDVISGGPKDE